MFHRSQRKLPRARAGLVSSASTGSAVGSYSATKRLSRHDLAAKFRLDTGSAGTLRPADGQRRIPMAW